MPIAITCPGCRTTYQLRDHLAGKTVRCPACPTVLRIPAAPVAEEDIPTLEPAGPPRSRANLLLLVSLLWAIVAWYVATLAPWLAFVPGVELLHLVLPAVTAGLVLVNLAVAVSYLRYGEHALALLPNTAVQVVLFTVLFFQIGAHLGAEFYRLDTAPTPLDWWGFSLAHALRATDVLDGVEAYGLRLQTIRHAGGFVGGVLVLYHLVVNVFVLSLLWGIWTAASRWLRNHPARRWTVAGLLLVGFVVWATAWALCAFWLRPWQSRDIPWWFAECALRVVDCADCIDSFDITLHQVPREWIEGSLTLGCRLYLALLVGLVVQALWGRRADTSKPRVGYRPALAALALVAALLAVLLPAALLVQPEAALPGLAEAVRDDARSEPALRALRRLGVAAAPILPALATATTEVPQRAEAVVEAIGYLGPTAAATLAAVAQQPPEATAHVAVIGLARLGPVAAPHLVQVWAATGSADLRALAAAKLTEQGTPAVSPLVATTTEANFAANLHWIKELDPYWTLRTTANALVVKAQKVPDLLARLQDSRDTRHEVAADALGELGLAALDAVPALTERAGDKRTRLRLAAVRALGRIGPAAKDALQVLVERGADADDVVRAAAVESLQAIAPDWPTRAAARQAVPALVGRLGDTVPAVRVAAVEILGRIGPGAATAAPGLIARAADTNPAVRVAVVQTLGRVGPVEQVLPAVLSRLTDPASEVVEVVHATLERLGPPAVAALVAALEDASYDAPAVVRAIVRLGNAAADVVPGKAAVERLIPFLADKDEGPRAFAVGCLHRMGAAADAAVPALITALSRGRKPVRAFASALEAVDLKWRERPEAVPAALEGCQRLNVRDPIDGHSSTDALREFGTALKACKSALPTLLGTIPRERQDPKKLLPLLAEIDPDWQAHPAWRKALEDCATKLQDPNATTRLVWVQKLQTIGPPAAPIAGAVVPLLADTDQNVRISALVTLPTLDQRWTTRPEVDDLMVKMVAELAAPRAPNRPAPLISFEVVDALGPAAVAAVPALIGLLDDKSRPLRHRAAQALAKIGPGAKAALPALRKLLAEEMAKERRQFFEGIIARIERV